MVFEKKQKQWVILTIFMSITLVLSACSQAQMTTMDESGETYESQDNDVEIRDTRTQDEQDDELFESLLADGVYETEKTYSYHSGTETIAIRVEIENDVVSDISIESRGDTHPTSQNFITGVDRGLPELTIGKRVGDIQLPARISGSSLTTAAVQEYLDELAEK
ncbi:MAG: hypothetical protein ACMXYA_03675 [Candidatus Woesearchaeota archaeon]